jgi:hypothetical protein
MGTPIKYQQYHQILSFLMESSGKERVNFLKFAGTAGTFGKSIEWNFGGIVQQQCWTPPSSARNG